MEIVKTCRIFFLFVLIVVIITGCAATSVKIAGNEVKNTEAIKPSAVHEDCMELLPGQVLSYSFETSQPVTFNIHCHDEGGISYPVQKDDVSKDEGTFYCERRQHYCLMWTNPHKESINLIYDYKVTDKQR